MSTPDPDLTEFACQGCPEAFRRLVERHVNAVYSTASRLLRDWPEDAADVTQAVFILLARKAPRLSPDIVVAAWLHRQTMRLALNARRADARRAARERTAVDLLTMNIDDPHDFAAALQSHVDEAIHALPESDRQMIALHYFDQCRQQEIATRMGLSADAVQKRISRALDRVRQHLARRGVVVPAVALAAWFGGSSVEAAPRALGEAVATKALIHAAAGPGFLTQLITIMAHSKALAAGAALGLAAGGFSAAWSNTGSMEPARLAGATTKSPAPPMVTGEKPAATGFPGTYTLPQPAATPEGLVKQLLEFIAQPDSILTQGRLAAWLGRIPPGSWPAFTALAAERLYPDERSRWMRDLAHAWALTDPQRAIAGLAVMEASPGGASLAGTAFAGWHRVDPAAALLWLVEHQDDPALAKCVPGFVTIVAGALAKQSPSAAITWASQLIGDDFRKAALEPLLTNLWKNHDEGELHRLCSLIAVQPDADFVTVALSEVFSLWMKMDGYAHSPVRLSLGEADAWLATLPPGSQSTLAAGLMLKAALASPEEATPQHALEHIQRGGPQALEEKARQLIGGAKTIGPGARAWLLPLLTGPDREALIHQAARQTVARSGAGGWYSSSGAPCHAAAIQWAAELADPTVRDPLVYGLYRQWLESNNDNPSNQGRNSAPQWLDRTPLPAGVKAIALRAKADYVPKNPSGGQQP